MSVFTFYGISPPNHMLFPFPTILIKSQGLMFNPTHFCTMCTKSSLLTCLNVLLPRVTQVDLLLDVIHPDFVPWYGAPSMLHVAAYHRRMGVVACLLVADLKLFMFISSNLNRSLDDPKVKGFLHWNVAIKSILNSSSTLVDVPLLLH